MKKSHWITLGVFCHILFLIASSAVIARAEQEQNSGEWFSLVNETGEVLIQTAATVHTGDLYITADNERYIVDGIDGKTARCRYDGNETMPELAPSLQQADMFSSAEQQEEDTLPVIAIYHTHDDESYVPSDGVESIRGDGGIYDVGEVLRDELEKQGFDVLYSEARHDPHDVNAYNRSRETAASLMRDGGDVLIDVHRDAVPPENYATKIDGEAATRIKLVVGQSNPNQHSNMEFAKTIKAAMDEQEPGLSAGIYEGKGVYNQDLTPQAILIEVGAHTNSKEAAQNGVAAFAQSLPLALGITPGELGKVLQPEMSGSSKNADAASGETETSPDSAEKEAEAKPLPEEARRINWGLWITVGILVVAAGAAYWFYKRRAQA